MEPIKDISLEVFRFTWFAQPNENRLVFSWLDFYEVLGFFASTRLIRRYLGEVQSYQHISHSNAWTQVSA
jgi:hypothetical protein